MIYPEFISEGERNVLLHWIESLYKDRCSSCGMREIPELHLGIKLLDTPSLQTATRAHICCIFGANPMGNKEGQDLLGEVPPEVYQLKERIIAKFNLRAYDPQKTFINYFLPGTGLGAHRHYPPKGMADLRTNIVLQMPEGGEPVVADRIYQVEERGLWVFNANLQHWTGKIKSSLPRIVIGFGWDVPDFDDVHWDGAPLPNPPPRWQFANIRRVDNKWISDYYEAPLSDESDVTGTIRQFYEKTPFPDYNERFSLSDLEADAKLFARHLRDQCASPILEVGCGTGQLTNYLGVKHKIIGLDMCENSLKRANDFRDENNLENVQFIHSNLFEYSTEMRFPLVICNGVLHCTFAPYEGFKALAKFVAPGGHIIIGLYNKYGRIPFFVKKWMVSRDLWPWKVPTDSTKENAWFMDQYMIPHETTHTMNEIRQWFERNDFSLVNSAPPLTGNLFQPKKASAAMLQCGMFFRGESFFFMIGKKL